MDKEDFAALQVIVDKFLTHRCLEVRAAATQPVLTYLRKLLKAVRSCSPAALDRTALAAIEDKLAAICARHFRYVPVPIDMNNLITGVISILEEAIRGFETGKPLNVGGAWNMLIRELTTFCKTRGLPIGAAHSNMRADSPFVLFVQRIQDALPIGLAQHNSTTSGLAKAIGRARGTPGPEADP